MDTRNEIRDFLTTRRSRITPEQAGLPNFGGRRRVVGLRREEVAMLAGVSVDYYTRLERGNLSGVSEGVLESLARALALDEAERAHLFNLARAASPSVRARKRANIGAWAVRPGVQRILDALVMAPAYVRNERLDILAINELGNAVFSEAMEDAKRPANLARYQFLDPRSRAFFIDWDSRANDCVALLRAAAGRDPYDKALTDLIGELSMRSDAFRTRWATHNVRLHRTGVKHFRHPLVGLLELGYEALELPGDAGLSLMAYTAVPGSPSHDGLQLLASLVVTRASAKH
jgi:transcriptional regulator with XRE-family HTH domain